MPGIPEEEKKIYLRKTRWLYLGVFGFSAVIIIFFVWAGKISWQTYSWQKTREQQIIHNAKTDIDAYITREQQILAAEQKAAALEQSREMLNQLLNKNTTTPTADDSTATGTTVNQ